MTDTPDEKSTAIEETELAHASTATDVGLAEADEATEAAAVDQPVTTAQPEGKGIDWAKVVAFGVIPALALILALTAGGLKFVDNSASDDVNARIESVQVAKDSTVTLLSYQPDKVQQQLTDAQALLTGSFRDEYTKLINNVVIPGAQQKQISAVATVPSAASVSADQKKAVVLVFVNQTVIVGADPPSATASSVRVELEKVDGKWLISKFEPV